MGKVLIGFFEPDLVFNKYTKNISLCCQIFFEYVDKRIRFKIPEYREAGIHDNVNGIIFCPDCIIVKIKRLERN